MRAVYAILLVSFVYVSGKTIPREVSQDVPETCNNLSFACQDLHVARKCKAVTACIEIWEEIKVPKEVNNEICDLCLEMVKEARDQLLSNETQEELKEVFEGSCNLLPVKAIASECRKVVDEIVPDLIEMLASRMNPNQVCSVSGLCNNGLLKKLIKQQYVSAKPLSINSDYNNPAKCKSCTKGMMFVRRALKFIPENDFTSLLLHSCMEEFQGNHAQCAQVVYTMLPVYEYILKTDEELLCSLLGRCKDFSPDPLKKECKLCTKFVGATRFLPKLVKPLDSVKNFSLTVCEEVGWDDSSKAECQSVINYNFEKVVHLLWTQQDSKTVCYRTCGFEPKRQAAITEPQVPRYGAKICAVCETLLQTVINDARKPSVRNDVKIQFSKLCNKTGNFGVLCNAFIDEYFELIYDEIVDHLKAKPLCVSLRLCSSNKTVDISETQVSQQLCRACQIYGTFDVTVKDQAVFNLKSAIENRLGKICDPKFDLFDCDKFVKQAAPIVFNFLRVGDPSVFCSHMEQCPALDVPPPTVGDNTTCEFCEALVSYVRTVVTSKSTEEEFRTAFYNMCTDLKEFSTECKALVDEYFDQFYDFLMKNLDPQAVCSTLGLCGNLANRARIMMKLTPALVVPQPKVAVLLSKAEAREERLRTNRPISVPMVELVEARPMRPVKLEKAKKIITGIEVEASRNTKDKLIRVPLTKIEGNSVHAMPVHIPNVIIQSDVECSLCKAAVMYIETQLENNKTEARIRQALDQVCTLFPAELSSQCVDFINIYTDTFITLFIQEANPNVVCSVVKACTVQDAILPHDFNEEHHLQMPTFVQCELCKKVMEYLENYLGNNKTEAKIKEALENVCLELPTKYATECKTFVDQYSDIIITLLSKEIAPTMVCAALGLCPGEKSGGEVQCTVCQYVLHFLQTQLMQNATEEEIKAAVERVCAALPKSLADNCDAFVEEFGSSLIVLIAQRIDPSIVCVNLKICPTQTKPVKSGLKIEKCDTCEMVVNYMDKLLENDNVDSEIVKLVEKVCNVLPEDSRAQCSSIIELYGPYILQMIGQVSDSQTVCQAIDLCARTEKAQLLGAKKCTYGPSYWCQSTAHATACKAHDYCRQKVWKM